MGESAIGIEALRYIYYTGENGCITNGPNCHLCMNEVFRSDGLQDVDHVFTVAQGGLVPFFIRSLVFLYGMDTPFSLKDIWEPYLPTECVQCSKRRYLSVTGPELSQVMSETDKQMETDVVREVVESLVQLVSTPLPSVCSEEDGSTEASPSRIVIEKKRRMCSNDAEIYAKRVKIEIEEVCNPAMTLCWGNIPNDQGQANHGIEPLTSSLERTPEQTVRDAGVLGEQERETTLAQPDVSENVKEEPRIIELVSLDAPYPQRQYSQLSTSSYMTASLDMSHNEPDGPSYAIPIIAKYDSHTSTTTLERTSELSDEPFPFMRGRCPSTVTDPIISWIQLSSYIQAIEEEHLKNDALKSSIFQKYFKDRQFIHCSACDTTVRFFQGGFNHILGKNHFMEVTKRNEVFSMYMDLRRLCELLCEAKMEFMRHNGQLYIPKRTAQFIMDIPDPSTLPKKTTRSEEPETSMVETVPDQKCSRGTSMLSWFWSLPKTLFSYPHNNTGAAVLNETEINPAQHGVSENVEDEQIITEPVSSDVAYAQQDMLQQDSQASTSNCITLSSDDESDCILNTGTQNIGQFGVMERLTMQPEEWFPFMTGRCRSTVSDPISTFKQFRDLLPRICGKRRTYIRILREHFDVEREIVCYLCNKNVSLCGGRFKHFLSEGHFSSVIRHKRVFSISLDLNRLCDLIKRAKNQQKQQLTSKQDVGTTIPHLERLTAGSSRNESLPPNVTARKRELKKLRDAQAVVHSRPNNSSYSNLPLAGNCSSTISALHWGMDAQDPIHQKQNSSYAAFLQDNNSVPRASAPDCAPGAETPNSNVNDTSDVQHIHYPSPTIISLQNKSTDFPFLRGRKKKYVEHVLVNGSFMQSMLDAVSNEIKSNHLLRTLTRDIYFHDQAKHFCNYCQHNVKTNKLIMHSLSASHFTKVMATGEVFCKIRDYDQITSIMDELRGKLNDRSLGSESLLPFGYGKPRTDDGQFESFQHIFDFLTSLQRTGKFDAAFLSFVREGYRDIVNVDLCSYCGSISIKKNIAHFFSLSHIAKAMECGKVFVHDVRILKKMFRFYLTKLKAKDVDVILQAVEKAIENRTYSRYSADFRRMLHQIDEASRKRQI